MGDDWGEHGDVGATGRPSTVARAGAYRIPAEAPATNLSLDSALEADIHKAIYIAIIDGRLHLRGSKEAFAARVAISSRTLRALLDPKDFKTPSLELSARVVEALALPPEQRSDLLDHMRLARERRLLRERRLITQLAERPASEIVMDVRHAHHAATFATDPIVARAGYRMVAEESTLLLRRMDAHGDPIPFVELCLVAHDTLCVLDRPARALYYAKLARFGIEQIDALAARRHRERISHLVVNSLRAEAVVYGDVGLPRRAYLSNRAALAWMRRRGVDDFVLTAYTTIGLLKAIAASSRFTLKEVNALADRVRRACDGSPDPIAPLVDLQAREARVRAYVAYGEMTVSRAREAQALLAPAVETMGRLPLVGSLHEVTALSTLAALRYARKDRAGWLHYVESALALAVDAGLSDQVAKIHEKYGSALQDIEGAGV